jgi:hypothetical protein
MKKKIAAFISGISRGQNGKKQNDGHDKRNC